MTRPPGVIPLAPAIPTWRTDSGGLSAMCRAVVVAASTGPTPHTSPSWSQSSMSVAATRRITLVRYGLRRRNAGCRDASASHSASDESSETAKKRRVTRDDR